MQQRVRAQNPAWKQKRSESTEQQAVVSWFRRQYPGKMIIAIPNAQKLLSSAKNRFAMQKVLAREGLTPGVSDLFVAVPRVIRVIAISSTRETVVQHGLFLEMKAEGKTKSSLSKEQIKFLAEMQESGYHTAWAAGFEEARKIIEEYLK